MKKKINLGLILSHITLIIACILTVIPIWWILNTALSSRVSIASTKISFIPEGITIKNFIEVLTNDNFLLWLRNSIIFSAGTTLLTLFCATIAAYAFSRFEFKGKKIGLMFFIVLMMLPITAAMVGQFRIFREFGLLNKYTGMILLYSSSAMAFSIWNLKGYFDTIPKSLEEAAVVDGASKVQIFINIILPLSKPALAITALFIFIIPWTDFAAAFLFISDPNKYTLAMGLYQWASDPRNIPWPLFAAGSIVVAAPLAILYLVFQRYIVSGLTVGGVKE
ncbi:sugar ABC transporter permease [Alkalithermobacter paradoxus]|uniref:Maltose transport system permease protein MalG n=1 Tax=Alkalithermobacter paradoxus TaxID=29349 RepID=A0A1V4I5Y0_9FIRM|nr:maltose transport system permease protein MalG [[Clostridium] thermoalcaliphilum]